MERCRRRPCCAFKDNGDLSMPEGIPPGSPLLSNRATDLAGLIALDDGEEEDIFHRHLVMLARQDSSFT